jgi:hypothetical protein
MPDIEVALKSRPLVAILDVEKEQVHLFAEETAFDICSVAGHSGTM